VKEDLVPTVRRALIVVDVQREYFEGPLAIRYPPVQESLARILDAVDVAGQEGVPVVVVQQQNPEGAALFADGSPSWLLHPDLEVRVGAAGKRVVKNYASVFDHTGLADWLRQNDVNTVTLVGYMVNNCILATASAAAPLGFSAEVLSDAIGAVDLANEAGSVSARQLYETLLVLLHSNFAAVATTDKWAAAVAAGSSLPRGNLRESATDGQVADRAGSAEPEPR
jgi:nicotinamidase-related amidase